MWISKYVCLFIIYSFMGWVYETIFCTIKGGKRENRGFLYGPICPIYGTGAIAASLIMKLTLENQIELSWWQIYLISVVGSAALAADPGEGRRRHLVLRQSESDQSGRAALCFIPYAQKD